MRSLNDQNNRSSTKEHQEVPSWKCYIKPFLRSLFSLKRTHFPRGIYTLTFFTFYLRRIRTKQWFTITHCLWYLKKQK